MTFFSFGAIVSAVVISSSSLALASGLSEGTRSQLAGHIAKYEPRMTEVAHQSWRNPELGYLETATVDALTSELEENGLETERGGGNIPTACVAKAGATSGHVVAILA